MLEIKSEGALEIEIGCWRLVEGLIDPYVQIAKEGFCNRRVSRAKKLGMSLGALVKVKRVNRAAEKISCLLRFEG